MTACKIDGCDKPTVGRGWCNPHYRRWQATGDPGADQPIRGYRLGLHERFKRAGYILTESGCHEWPNSKNSRGYGTLGGDLNGPTLAAHRVAWEIAHGPIPPGMGVRHICDNPPCINPEHLLLGTHQDNMDDRTARERQVRGTRSSKAKLTEDQVRQMRALYATGAVRKVDLAAQFGIGFSTVRQVLNRQTWRHVA